MKRENANQFSSSLYYFISERVAGQYGFSSNRKTAAKEINKLIPSFRCEMLLNMQSFGTGDGLGLLLKRLTLSKDGTTQYGFVVGSEKQTMGCAAAMVKVITEIDNSLRRCSIDLRW